MAGIIRFNRIYTRDRNLELIQDQLAKTFLPLTSNVVLDCQLMEDLALETAYQNKIEHKLDRVPRGLYPVMANDFFLFKVISKDNRFITISVTKDVTVNMVVF